MSRSAFVARPTQRALRALNYSPALEVLGSSPRGQACRPLKAFLKTMGPAYGSVFTRADCRFPNGIELLSQSDMFAFSPVGRRIRTDSLPNPLDHEIRRWQVLLAGAGTLGKTELYGRATIADDRIVGRYVGPDAMVLTFAEEGGAENLYVHAFLSSRVGFEAIRATSYGTKLLRFRGDMLGSLPVPIPAEATIERVADAMRQAVVLREQAASCFDAARRVIDQLPAVGEARQLLGGRARKAIAWSGQLPTIRAWTFASTGDAMLYLRTVWSKRLNDAVVERGIYQGPRFARIPCEAPHGIDLLSQRDVFLVRSLARRIVHPGMADEQLFVPDGALLVASHGQMTEGNLFGRVELAAAGLSRCAISQDIMRVVPKPQDWATAYAFFSSELGLRLLQSTAVGTSIPLMRLDLVASLPFPELPESSRIEIDRLVTQGVKARVEANRAEENAIELVEREVLASWPT